MIVSIHVLTFAEISVSCNYKFWYLKETKDLSKYIFTALFQVEVCVLVCISFLGNEKSYHNLTPSCYCHLYCMYFHRYCQDFPKPQNFHLLTL